uniref:Uncharacterized protein n=1 Tax=Rhizophora mucronata TaxID=61149 RepID=A0A2P2Q4Q3_RHIMU
MVLGKGKCILESRVQDFLSVNSLCLSSSSWNEL